MSLLRAYCRRVVQAVDYALNKVKESSKRSGRKRLLAVEEEMIRGYYMQIGQVYLHKHSDAPEECFLPFIRGIEESKRKIEEIKRGP